MVFFFFAGFPILKKIVKKNQKLTSYTPTRQNVHQKSPVMMLMIGARFPIEKIFTDRKKKAHITVKPINSSLESG